MRRVGHLNHGGSHLARKQARGLVERLHDKRYDGAGAQGRAHEIMPIHALAGQSHVHVARFHIT